MRIIASLLLLFLPPLVALVTGAEVAKAQMVLPGAVAPTPEGTAMRPDDHPARAKPRADGEGPVSRAISGKVLAPATLAGQILFLNGRKSQIAFGTDAKALAVTRLLLFGSRPSDSRDECQVDVSSVPIATTDLGRPDGLSRIQLALPSCPPHLRRARRRRLGGR